MGDISEKEAQELIRQFNETKLNVHSFFTKVIQEKDTTKTGNLTIEELGMPRLPFRSLKELSLFSRKIANQPAWHEYFQELGEILTSSSLSKDALLMKLSVTQKKELADVTPKETKKNDGWFRKKDQGQNQMQVQ